VKSGLWAVGFGLWGASVALMLAACGARPAPAAQPSSHTAATAATTVPARATASGLAIGELSFEVKGNVMWQLATDGRLRVGGIAIGSFGSDGVFSFDAGHGIVTARLESDGRVHIRGQATSGVSDLPGQLSTMLPSYNGDMPSGYILQGDATAVINTRLAPLEIKDDGTLTDGVHTLSVRGVTPATRKTALVIYILLSMIA
jgi:hypothetical protein